MGDLVGERFHRAQRNGDFGRIATGAVVLGELRNHDLNKDYGSGIYERKPEKRMR